MGVLVAIVLGRLRLPTVAGLLLSGALIGPQGLALVHDMHAIEVIAEVGVVLLLFTIGLEFSLARLRHIFQRVALGGVLQVGGTIGVVVAVALAFGESTGTAVFFGFAVALSSTAIVLRGLAERRELDAPHGRFIVGTLIFQDLCVVPMVLLVPLLGSDADSSDIAAAIGVALGKATLVVVGVLFFARLIVPRLLDLVDANRSREVFLLGVLALCIGTAWLTSLAGLSLALGAFLGGMVVADTEYSHRAMGDILPLRDVFVSFFFVSLGMFFDVDVVREHPWLVLLLLLGFVLGKGLLATLAALIMRFPVRAAWLAGVGLAQFGEFGFVLVRLGIGEGVVAADDVAPLLNAGIVTMFLTPLMVHWAPHITAGERLLAPLARLLRTRSIEEADTPANKELDNHVVIVGYGLAGQMLSRSLSKLALRHVVLDANSENVRAGRLRDEPLYYADATSEEALQHAHVERARAVVVVINDPQAVHRVVAAIRRVSASVPVFLRTHYLSEGEGLVRLGATDVVAGEVEGGVEILARLLRELELPRNVIDAEVHHAREETQATARAVSMPRPTLEARQDLAGLKVESVLVTAVSPAAGRSPRQLNLRQETGALIVALRRNGALVPHPPPDDPLIPGDVAYLIGEVDAVRRAIDLLGPMEAEAG